MKLKVSVLAIAVLVLPIGLAAQTSEAGQWVGVWQGELDGQPGVTVTLGRDGGNLEGTIVFNVVSREGGEPHVIGHDAHAMIHVGVVGNTMTFQVIRSGDSQVHVSNPNARELHLTMRLTGDEKAQLACGDCGGPGSTELVRIH